MSVSRRLFLKAFSGTALIASLPHAVVSSFAQNKKALIQDGESRTGITGIPVVSERDPLYYYDSTAFSAYLGSIFRVYLSRRKYLDLKLVEVSQLKQSVPGKDGFVLLFRDSRANRLPGGLYKIEHAALGTFSLMLGPVDRGSVTYEAIINRLYP